MSDQGKRFQCNTAQLVYSNWSFSAIAIGTAFTHASSLISFVPVFGAAFQKVKKIREENDHDAQVHEAVSATAKWGASLTGSALQTYAVAALLNISGTTTIKGATCIGSLLFMTSTVPTIINNLLLSRESCEVIVAKLVASLLETVGLAITLTWWGTKGESLPKL